MFPHGGPLSRLDTYDQNTSGCHAKYGSVDFLETNEGVQGRCRGPRGIFGVHGTDKVAWIVEVAVNEHPWGLGDVPQCVRETRDIS